MLDKDGIYQALITKQNYSGPSQVPEVVEKEPKTEKEDSEAVAPIAGQIVHQDHRPPQAHDSILLGHGNGGAAVASGLGAPVNQQPSNVNVAPPAPPINQMLPQPAPKSASVANDMLSFLRAYKNMEAEIVQLKERLEEARNVEEQLKQAWNTQGDTIKTLEKRVEDEMKNAEKEKEELKNQMCAEFNTKMEAKVEEVEAKKNSEISTLENALTLAHSIITSRNAQIENLKDESVQSAKLTEETEKKYQELKNKLVYTENVLAAEKADKESTRGVIADMECRIKKRMEEKSEMAVELEKAKEENSDNKAELVRLSENVDELKKENERAKDEYVKSVHEISKKLNAEVEKKLTKVKQTHEEKVAELEGKILKQDGQLAAYKERDTALADRHRENLLITKKMYEAQMKILEECEKATKPVDDIGDVEDKKDDVKDSTCVSVKKEKPERKNQLEAEEKRDAGGHQEQEEQEEVAGSSGEKEPVKRSNKDAETSGPNEKKQKL